MCDRKRDCGEQGEEEGVKILGRSGASSLGVALGRLELGKQPNHQKFFQAEGLESAKGFCGNIFTFITWESSIPPFRG